MGGARIAGLRGCIPGTHHVILSRFVAAEQRRAANRYFQVQSGSLQLTTNTFYRRPSHCRRQLLQDAGEPIDGASNYSGHGALAAWNDRAGEGGDAPDDKVPEVGICSDGELSRQGGNGWWYG